MSQPEPEEPVKVTYEVMQARSLSVEIRSAVAWLTWTIATPAWAFGFIDARAAIASLTAGTLIGLSTQRTTPRRRS